MAIIQVLTFKGCQTTVDFIQQLADLAKEKNLDFKIDVITVPTLEKAEEMGLYGSPTVLINGEEYQKNISAKPGFY